jgi:hypothetical protein
MRHVAALRLHRLLLAADWSIRHWSPFLVKAIEQGMQGTSKEKGLRRLLATKSTQCRKVYQICNAKGDGNPD